MRDKNRTVHIRSVFALQIIVLIISCLDNSGKGSYAVLSLLSFVAWFQTEELTALTSCLPEPAVQTGDDQTDLWPAAGAVSLCLHA